MKTWILMATASAVVLLTGGQAVAQLHQSRTSSLFPSAQSASSSSASPTIQSGQSSGFSSMKPGGNVEINPQPLPPGGQRNGATPKPGRVHLALGKVMNPEAGASNAHAKLVADSKSEAAMAHSGGASHARQGPGQAMLLTQGIGLVNGRVRGITVTPGGQYVIAGRGFGDKPGQVRLVDGSNPAISLAFVVEVWRDDAITVDLPTTIAGVLDLSDTTLQVTAADGTPYSKSNIAFYAARTSSEYTTADLHVAQMFTFSPDASWTLYQRPFPAYRWVQGRDIGCPNPGTDMVTLNLKPGWTWTSAWVIQETPATANSSYDNGGEKGNTVVSGAYALTGNAASNRFNIAWGVFRSHRGEGNGIRGAFNDFCESSYDIGVTLVGPAGTSPF